MEAITAKTPWKDYMGDVPMHLDYFDGSMFEMLESVAKKYPNYVAHLDGQYVEQALVEAQRYAAQNCSFIGAQGMLKERRIVDKINCELDRNIEMVCDPKINWRYDCDYCFSEHINE